MPKSVSSLGKRVFDGCSNLKSLNICVPIIAEEAFYNITGLEAFTVSDEVLIIGKKAFANCTALKEVDLREEGKISEILDEAFSGCTSLQRIRFPSSLTKIGSKLFKGCDDCLGEILFGGKRSQWEKIEKPSKNTKDWTGLTTKKFSDMADNRCKGGDYYKW